jgi:hypothetical protein
VRKGKRRWKREKRLRNDTKKARGFFYRKSGKSFLHPSITKRYFAVLSIDAQYEFVIFRNV